ncbi:MAG: galactokinase family protein [Candidatus Hydrogenedentota bacterium]
MEYDSLKLRPAAYWRQLLGGDPAELHKALDPIYGPDSAFLTERARLLQKATASFEAAFGDEPMALFRAPGRVNLRGMHVDTHGGYVNLLTHQREIVVAAGRAPAGEVHAVNTNPEYPPVRAHLGEWAHSGIGRDWHTFLESDVARRALQQAPGSWRHYVLGALLSAQHRFPGHPPPGLKAAVAGGIPPGAALSSSAAVCTAVLLAALAIHGRSLPPAQLIHAARDAEWYTGARTGTCDQAAVVLGTRGRVVHGALRGRFPGTNGMAHAPFPDELRLLVINSHTRRNLSGAGRLAYSRNRFAYSLALEVLRQELAAEGLADQVCGATAYLSDFAEPRLTPWGGYDLLYTLLQRIPDEIALPAIKKRYNLPYFAEVFKTYFGHLEPAQQPSAINLRGPLVFGLAESERARVFPELLCSGAWEAAGRLMNCGHQGDRVMDANGEPFVLELNENTLEGHRLRQTPLHEIPGAYGASSPALDALTDAALRAGALGACLTGAGIAGSVLALCVADQADHVAEHMRNYVGSAAYARWAGFNAPLSREEAEEAVMTNVSVAGASWVRGT